MKSNSLIKHIDRLCLEKNDPFGVRKSTAAVMKNAKYVQLVEEKILPLVEVLNKRIKEKRLLTSDQFGTSTLSSQIIFLQDCVNFCFWAEKGEERWSVEYPLGTVKNGWYALTACFSRALQEGIPILNCDYLKHLSITDARHIFRSNNKIEIPLLDSRVQLLRESGKALQSNFHGNFENLIKEANYDAVAIVSKILEYFPSFQDIEQFEGKEAIFLKRAQICAYDISLLPEMLITNAQLLTVFADYKLPQLLRAFGVLVYNQRLSEMVDNCVLLKRGSGEEIEIRSATVWAGELISEILDEPSATVDNALWSLGAESSETLKPYHRVYTTSY